VTGVEIKGVTKAFGTRKVVEDVSFSVPAGEVLGLVGPNGAGKTTTIRMVLDIIKPDAGEIHIDGQAPGQGFWDSIGYLPEERGLYRNLTVTETLLYLASLKDMDRREALSEADALLETLGMAAHRRKKVSELSRGMAQLIQFAATLVHRPALVVLDEPFAALDPVNVRLIKDVVQQRRQQGTTFILSTHQMNQVEELCDQVVMIHQGRVALEGRLGEIKRSFRTNSVLLACEPFPTTLPNVERTEDRGNHRQLYLKDGADPQHLLAQLMAMGTTVERFEIATPTLEEVFIQVVQGRAT